MTRFNWKNKGNTGERNCKCGSWKNHWLNYSGSTSWPTICSVDGCNNEPSLGGHVYQVDDGKEYIVPLCNSCNKRSDVFDLRGSTSLARANKSETCEKYRLF